MKDKHGVVAPLQLRGAIESEGWHWPPGYDSGRRQLTRQDDEMTCQGGVDCRPRAQSHITVGLGDGDEARGREGEKAKERETWSR